MNQAGRLTHTFKREKLVMPRSPESCSDDERPTERSMVTSLPADVLARAAMWTRACHGRAAAIALSLTCRSMRTACEPYLFDELTLEGVKSTLRAAETLGSQATGRKLAAAKLLTEGVLKHVKELSIELETAFPTLPSRSRLLTSLETLLVQATGITSLELHVGPAETVQPFAAIISRACHKALSALPDLANFRLGNLSIWLHDLAESMHGWQNLKTLEVAFVRSDCARVHEVLRTSLQCRLVKLRIGHSSMTNKTVAWLLSGQTELETLSLPVQGLEGTKILAALEKVVPSLKSLDLRDMWATDQQRSKTSKTSVAKLKLPADKDELVAADDKVDLPPFFRMLGANACTEALHLNPTILPTSMSTPEAVRAVAASLLEVKTLFLDDFPPATAAYASSALAMRDGRVAVHQARQGQRLRRRKQKQGGQPGQRRNEPPRGLQSLQSRVHRRSGVN
ncbi:hypothetical protein JCM3774_002458 [Rhodotorula dairenensis]